MNKVLIVTYYWPPSGGAGVQRWLKFAKYLPESGWEPVILTVDPDYAAYPVTDSSLEKEVTASLRVFKTKATDYFSVYKKDKSKIPTAGFANSVNNSLKGKIMRFIRGNFFIPDPRKGWNKYAFKKACELIETEGIQHVITTSPPHSTQLIGLNLKSKYPSITWTADLRDPWTDIYYYNLFYPTFISKAIDLSLEKKVLRTADRIITVGKSLMESFISKEASVRSKASIITNGYDEDDFKGMSFRVPDKFTISYTGTLSDTYPVNGFLEALDNFKSKGNDFFVRFVGTVSPDQKKLILSKAGTENIEFISYTDHKSAINYMAQSSLLLLIIPEHKSNKSIITGKIFEYLATGKPILCLGPADGDAAAILSGTSLGRCFDYDNVTGIADFIESVNSSPHMSVTETMEFSHRNIVKKLVSFLQ